MGDKVLSTEPDEVDEYSISLGDNEAFPTILVSLKLGDGTFAGPFEFTPSYAHQLSDELCIASARATKKATGDQKAGRGGS